MGEHVKEPEATRRVDHAIPVAGGQNYQIDRFRPEDAPGIANLFYAVYGPDYPFDAYYIPERLREENHNGNMYSVVARTPAGDIVGHIALYRSSPPCQDLYEVGQGLVLKNYRHTFIAYRLFQYILETLAPGVQPAGIFCESVCNHVASQKACASFGMKEVALEVDLMPVEVYQKEMNLPGRVSCLIQFRSIHDRPHEVFIPEVYRAQIASILSDLEISRVITPAPAAFWPEGECDIQVKFFSFAGVARANVILVGEDFEAVVARMEQQASEQNIVVLQFFLKLDSPWVGFAVKHLRSKGYFLAGYVPRWFDADGLLMHKVCGPPNWEGIQLFDAKAGRILEMVRADWAEAPH